MTEDTTTLQCRRIRLYRRMVVWLIVLYVPVVFPISVGLFKLLHTFKFSFAFAGFWLAMWLGSALLLAFSPCPNCGKRLLKYWWFSKKCAHCGFRC